MNNTLTRLFLLLLNLVFLTTAQADNPKLNLVLAKLASVKHVQAEFEEIKKISMLKDVLTLSGRLEYTAPDSISKQTLKPEPELFSVKGNDLHVRNAAGEETDLLLTSYPTVEIFIEAYRGLLAGDLKKLTSYYSVHFTGDINHWTISLTPLDNEAQELIKKISADGTGADINKITVYESNGDSSIMQIKNKQDRG